MPRKSQQEDDFYDYDDYDDSRPAHRKFKKEGRDELKRRWDRESQYDHDHDYDERR